MQRTALLLAALSTSLLAPSPVPGVTLANTEQRSITSTAIGQRYDLLVSLPEGSTKLVAAFAKEFDDTRLANLETRFTVYRGENHNSVRLASFPAGLYWIYRPSAGAR